MAEFERARMPCVFGEGPIICGTGREEDAKQLEGAGEGRTLQDIRAPTQLAARFGGA